LQTKADFPSGRACFGSYVDNILAFYGAVCQFLFAAITRLHTILYAFKRLTHLVAAGFQLDLFYLIMGIVLVKKKSAFDYWYSLW